MGDNDGHIDLEIIQNLDMRLPPRQALTPQTKAVANDSQKN